MTPDSLFNVCGQIIIITGVGGQLGNEYARVFLQRGALVAGLDIRSTSPNEALAASFPDNFLFLNSDVTSKDSLQGNLVAIKERFGTPTVLINNAAIDSPPFSPPEENGPFEEYPEASWDKVIDVNLKGVYLCCQVFGAAMALAGNGSIINIASIYGVVSPDQNLYEYRRQRGEVFYKPVAYSLSCRLLGRQRGTCQLTYHCWCIQPSGASFSRCLLPSDTSRAHGRCRCL